MLKVYGVKQCDTCRKVLKRLVFVKNGGITAVEFDLTELEGLLA